MVRLSADQTLFYPYLIELNLIFSLNLPTKTSGAHLNEPAQA